MDTATKKDIISRFLSGKATPELQNLELKSYTRYLRSYPDDIVEAALKGVKEKNYELESMSKLFGISFKEIRKLHKTNSLPKEKKNGDFIGLQIGFYFLDPMKRYKEGVLGFCMDEMNALAKKINLSFSDCILPEFELVEGRVKLMPRQKGDDVRESFEQFPELYFKAN
jgi:hypothetical protein